MDRWLMSAQMIQSVGVYYEIPLITWMMRTLETKHVHGHKMRIIQII